MKNISIEKLFIIIGFVFGLLFIFIIPPFESPDEDSHFKRAYSISNGELFQVKRGNVVGLTIPVEMNKYINEKVDWRDDRTKKYSYRDFYNDNYTEQNLSKKAVIEVNTSPYTPIIYLTPTLGILASKIIAPFNSPTTAYMLNFARFSSLIFYLILGYLAIKVTPIFKKSMFTILLIPMSLFLGSMVTYDNILIPGILLTVSMILRLIYDKDFKFDKKMLIVFSIIGYILLNVKIIYFPILALLLFIPKDKFKDNKKLRTYLMLAGIVLFFTILLKIPNYLTPNEGSKLASEQLHYVLTHPFEYIKTLVYNLVVQSRKQTQWMMGTFGLVDTKLPPIFIFTSFISMIIMFISDGITEKNKLPKYMKLTMIGYAVFAIVTMYTAMYVYWTPEVNTHIIGGNEIIGVQGRYFIPLLISIPMIASIIKISDKNKIYKFANEYFNKNVIVLVTMLFISIFVCLTRFWI